MNWTDDGGPAFPRLIDSSMGTGLFNAPETGMSLRDWFAGQAMAGYLAQPGINAEDETIAKIAYERADAMIAEGKKRHTEPK